LYLGIKKEHSLYWDEVLVVPPKFENDILLITKYAIIEDFNIFA